MTDVVTQLLPGRPDAATWTWPSLIWLTPAAVAPGGQGRVTVVEMEMVVEGAGVNGAGVPAAAAAGAEALGAGTPEAGPAGAGAPEAPGTGPTGAAVVGSAPWPEDT